MKRPRLLLLLIAIGGPIYLSFVQNCNRGLLGMLRSTNAYITIHPGGSYDYNNLFWVDSGIVFGVSGLLLFTYCWLQTKYRGWRRIVLPLIWTFGIELALWGFTLLFIGFGRCYQG